MPLFHHRSLGADIVDNTLDLIDFKAIYDTKESADKALQFFGKHNDDPYEIKIHLRCPHELVGEKGDQCIILNPEATDRVVYYIHGGGFVLQLDDTCLDHVDELAHRSGARIVMPIYPLAPHHTAAETFDMISRHYLKLVQDLPQETMVLLGGDSAGGTLSAGLCEWLIQNNRRVPNRLLLICPCVDCALDHPAIPEYEKVDPMLSAEGLHEVLRVWAGDWDISDPRISPINGVCRAMPPTWIFTSTHEILNPDTLDFARKMQDMGNMVKVTVGFELNHDYVMTRLPEAREAIDKIGAHWL